MLFAGGWEAAPGITRLPFIAGNASLAWVPQVKADLKHTEHSSTSGSGLPPPSLFLKRLKVLTVPDNCQALLSGPVNKQP